MKVSNAISFGNTFSQIESEVILSEILNISRPQLHFEHNKKLTENEFNRFKKILMKRRLGIPLQYITGYSYFMGLKFKVSRATLIPRQETEILVEECMKFIKNKKNPQILEIGCGCGNIAVALAKLTSSKVVSLDNSKKALEVANGNALFYGVQNKILFLKSNMFEKLPAKFIGKFDCLISNPPYIAKEEYENLQTEVQAEPISALIGGTDGLKYIKMILREGPRYIKNGSRVFVEIGYSQKEKVENIARENFSDYCFIKDYNNIDRVFVGLVR